MTRLSKLEKASLFEDSQWFTDKKRTRVAVLYIVTDNINLGGCVGELIGATEHRVEILTSIGRTCSIYKGRIVSITRIPRIDEVEATIQNLRVRDV